MHRFSQFLSRGQEGAYALMRIFCGLMFSFHGFQKVLGVLTQKTPSVGSQIWVGGVIELVGGLLMAVGLLTVCAAFLSSGTMAVAYAQFHWEFQFDANFLPGMNKGELALVYSLIFLFIATRGGGPFSLDAKLFKRDAPG